MKITKRQLKRLIAEEKQKLLNENNPIRNAEYMQGNYANVSDVSILEDAMGDLLQGSETDAFDDMGDDDDAADAAQTVLTFTIAQRFQSLGMIAQYEALIRTLR
jgi:hypothetical protein